MKYPCCIAEEVVVIVEEVPVVIVPLVVVSVVRVPVVAVSVVRVPVVAVPVVNVEVVPPPIDATGVKLATEILTVTLLPDVAPVPVVVVGSVVDDVVSVPVVMDVTGVVEDNAVEDEVLAPPMLALIDVIAGAPGIPGACAQPTSMATSATTATQININFLLIFAPFSLNQFEPYLKDNLIYPGKMRRSLEIWYRYSSIFLKGPRSSSLNPV